MADKVGSCGEQTDSDEEVFGAKEKMDRRRVRNGQRGQVVREQSLRCVAKRGGRAMRREGVDVLQRGRGEEFKEMYLRTGRRAKDEEREECGQKEV